MKIYTVITVHVGTKGVHIMNFDSLDKAKDFINSCSESQCSILNISNETIDKYSDLEVFYIDDEALKDFWTCGKIIYGTRVNVPPVKNIHTERKSYRFVFENELY